MGRIWLSVCRMYSETYIRVESEGAYSISAGDQLDPGAQKDFLYMMPEGAQETITGQNVATETVGSSTFGEKPMPLIMRFLHHRSS